MLSASSKNLRGRVLARAERADASTCARPRSSAAGSNDIDAGVAVGVRVGGARGPALAGPRLVRMRRLTVAVAPTAERRSRLWQVELGQDALHVLTAFPAKSEPANALMRRFRPPARAGRWRGRAQRRPGTARRPEARVVAAPRPGMPSRRAARAAVPRMSWSPCGPRWCWSAHRPR